MKYTAGTYTGTKCGNNYNERVGVQIVATDDTTGKRKYAFEVAGEYRTYKTPCLKIWEGIAHYKSGLNKADSVSFGEALREAEALAAEWNKKGTHIQQGDK